MSRRDHPAGPRPPEIDLHGLTPEAAFKKLGRGLHSARVRREARLLVITGRGFGNAAQVPILRGKVEAYLRGPEGRRAGVRAFELAARGGALLVTLEVNGRAREADDSELEEDDEH